MGWIGFDRYRYFISTLAFILTFFSFNGCNSGDIKDRNKAIALIQNYQIRDKSVSERLSNALSCATNDEIKGIEWNALKEKKNIYRVTCTVKMASREIHYIWLAYLSVNRITPLNMHTQDIMGGGFY